MSPVTEPFIKVSRVQSNLWSGIFSKIQGTVTLSPNLLFIGSMALEGLELSDLSLNVFKKI